MKHFYIVAQAEKEGKFFAFINRYCFKKEKELK